VQSEPKELPPEGVAGPEREANWLPAPGGPIFVVMRLYWPKEEALNRSWKPRVVRRTE
jgi:hypothetical protein